MTFKIRLAATLAVAAIGLAVPAAAEPMTIPMAGGHKGFIAGHANVVIPAYHVNFITSHQATASASIMAKTRLAMVLEGPTPELMRKLTDEAHADLVSQMTAAGLSVLPADQATAVAAPRSTDTTTSTRSRRPRSAKGESTGASRADGSMRSRPTRPSASAPPSL